MGIHVWRWLAGLGEHRDAIKYFRQALKLAKGKTRDDYEVREGQLLNCITRDKCDEIRETFVRDALREWGKVERDSGSTTLEACNQKQCDHRGRRLSVTKNTGWSNSDCVTRVEAR